MIRVITIGGTCIVSPTRRIGPQKSTIFAALLYLGLERGKFFSRSLLTDLLWPLTEQGRARHNLRQTLYKIRQLDMRLDVDSDSIGMPASMVDLDFLEPTRVLERLDTKLEILPGYNPQVSECYSEWLEEQRACITSVIRRHLVQQLIEERTSANWHRVELLARQVLGIDPYNEEATLALAEATAAAGSKAAALKILAEYRSQILDAHKPLRQTLDIVCKRISDLAVESPDKQESFFSGRQAELALLTRSCRTGGRSVGAANLVYGEAGIGKSRLIAEALKSLKLASVQCVTVRCRYSDSVQPFSIFADLIPRLLELPGSLGCSPESLGYLRRLTHVSADQMTISAAAYESIALRHRIGTALIDLVDSLLEESHLAVAIEDIQWLDGASSTLLRELILLTPERPLTVLLTSRIRETPFDAEELPCLNEVSLQPLSEHESAWLVHHLISPLKRQASPELLSWCYRITGGNPLHITELANHWKQGTIGYSIPKSLGDLIGRRLQKLRSNALRVLQVVACLGRWSTVARIGEVLQLPTIALLEALHELEQAKLITACAAAVEVSHDLNAEGARDLLLPTARALIHRSIASVLESESRQSTSAALHWECYRHWIAAGEHARGLQFTRASARHLLETGMPAEAAELLTQAIRSCSPSAALLALSDDLLEALRLSFQFDGVMELLDQRARWKAQMGESNGSHNEDELLRLQVHNDCTRMTEQVIEHALSCAECASASVLHRLTAASIAMASADRTYNQHCAERGYRAVTKLSPVSELERREKLRSLVIYHASFGDLDQGAEAARCYFESCRGATGLLPLLQIYRSCALAYRRAGHFTDSEDLLRSALSLSEKHCLPNQILANLVCLVYLCFEDGRLDEAQSWFDRGRSINYGHIDQLRRYDYQVSGALLCITRGEYAEARALVDLDFDEARRTVDPHIRTEQLAYVARLWLLESRERFGESTVEELISLYQRTRASSSADFVAQTVSLALHSQGRYEAASSMWGSYVTQYRRARHKLGPQWSIASELLSRPLAHTDFQRLGRQLT